MYNNHQKKYENVQAEKNNDSKKSAQKIKEIQNLMDALEEELIKTKQELGETVNTNNELELKNMNLMKQLKV